MASQISKLGSGGQKWHLRPTRDQGLILIFGLRRRKGDVLTELPSKVRQQVFIATTSMPSKKGKAPMPTAADVEGMMASEEDGWAGGGVGDGRSELADIYKETGLAKTPAACQYIQNLVEGGGKFLVFAHHISVLDALEAAAKATRRGVIRIDGSVKASERQALVDKFQVPFTLHPSP